jgi:hypothetical protein
MFRDKLRACVCLFLLAGCPAWGGRGYAGGEEGGRTAVISNATISRSNENNKSMNTCLSDRVCIQYHDKEYP